MAPVRRRQGDIDAARSDATTALRDYADAVRLADPDDLDTLTGAWLGIARVTGGHLDGKQKAQVVSLLARIEALASHDFYALYTSRLQQSLMGAALVEKHPI
jgi:hypothetical protein